MSIIEIRSPFSSKVVGTISVENQKTALGKLATAHRIFQKKNKKIPVSERIHILKRLREMKDMCIEKLFVINTKNPQ
jgi:hypothetical protein